MNDDALQSLWQAASASASALRSQSAASNRRSRWGRLRGSPVVSSHFFPGPTPQVGQRTACIRFGLSPRFWKGRINDRSKTNPFPRAHVEPRELRWVTPDRRRRVYASETLSKYSDSPGSMSHHSLDFGQILSNIAHSSKNGRSGAQPVSRILPFVTVPVVFEMR
jgi:hypothetical protein